MVPPIKYAVTYSSMQLSPWNTTVCWVPSKVSNEPRSWFARSTPALYGVAGSWVVDTTTVGTRPGAETAWG
ncbi:Uncharacterised protein [Mycobacterium tuberculosis]|nr:Uncharacterised protein [Mycobacterium tuberculosis]